MKLLGNIIWVVFGGLQIALEYLIGAVGLMITQSSAYPSACSV